MKRRFGWFFTIGLTIALVACGSEDASESANASGPTDVSDASDPGDAEDPSTAEQTRAQIILTLTGDAENGESGHVRPACARALRSYHPASLRTMPRGE